MVDQFPRDSAVLCKSEKIKVLGLNSELSRYRLQLYCDTNSSIIQISQVICELFSKHCQNNLQKYPLFH